MCGRFTVTVDSPADIAARFGGGPPAVETVRRYNVAPTERVAAVRATGEGDAREAITARWGLLPPWARSLAEKVQPINARAEGIGGKAMFGSLLARRSGRVLVPADGWYEWLRGEDPRQPRIPFHHVLGDGALFAFAGLLRVRTFDEEGTVASLTLVTTAANAEASRLHDRMPVVLPDVAAEDAWLSPDLSAADAEGLLRPLPDGTVDLRPASPLVNRAGHGHEGPVLLDPEATELPGADAQGSLLDAPAGGSA